MAVVLPQKRNCEHEQEACPAKGWTVALSMSPRHSPAFPHDFKRVL